MKICFSTLGCPEWNWGEITSVAKDLGYDGIEIRGVKNELYAPKIKEFQPANVKNTKQQLGVLGLEVACLTSACYMHKKELKAETVKEAFEYIDTAAALGARYIRVMGDTDPQPKGEVDVAWVKDTYAEIAEYGAKKGVTPLVETNGYFADTKKLKKLLDGVLNTGVIWDIHHPFRYFGESPEETLANIGPYVCHVHLKDSVIAGGKVKYTMLGYGDLPVRKCIEGLKAQKFEGFYSLEWVKRWDLTLEDAGIAFAQYAGFMHALK